MSELAAEDAERIRRGKGLSALSPDELADLRQFWKLIATATIRKGDRNEAEGCVAFLDAQIAGELDAEQIALQIAGEAQNEALKPPP
jgi:hypothetical protein